MNFSENNSFTYKEMIPMVLFAQLYIAEADRPNRNIAVQDTATNVAQARRNLVMCSWRPTG